MAFIINRLKIDDSKRKYYIIAGIVVIVLVIIIIVSIIASRSSNSGNINKSLQKYIVELHNKYRSLLANQKLGHQPSASNMKSVTWDSTLANFAENWVKKCNYEHSESAYGENLAVGTIFASMTDDDFRAKFDLAMQMWVVEEEQNFDYPSTCISRHPKNHQCGHYTQVIWADSNKVGCAIVECEGMQGRWTLPKSQLAFLISCNYNPPGNIWMNGVAQPPYQLGKACSACPPGSTCDRQGLCRK